MSWPEFLSGLSKKNDDKQDLVLLIDDDPQVLESLKDFLENNGYDVICAGDGLGGLKIFYNNNPDIVITDLIMPGMSGLDLLGKIREHDLDTEVVVLTAQRDLDTALEALKNQASDFLLKPVDLDLLLVRMEKALHRSRLKKEIRARTRLLEDLLKEVDSSKKHMETIVQNSPHAMLSYGRDGKIQSWNDEAKRITGYSRDEAHGKRLKDLFLLQDNMLDLQKAEAGECHKNVIGQIMTRDQEIRYVSRFANVLVNTENRIVGGVESFVDITDNLENDRLLEKRFLQVRTINEIGKRIAASTSVDELSEYICEHLVKTFFESSQVSLCLYDQDQERLVLRATAGNYTGVLTSRIRVGQDIPANAAVINMTYREGTKNLIPNRNENEQEPGGILEQAASAYNFPVRSKESVFGVLNIENAEQADLEDSDIAMLEALSEYIGISTERVGLLERITQQNRTLARQAKDLKEALTELESQNEIIEKQNQKFIDELSKAGEFQKSLLPEEFPALEKICFEASYSPSSQLGGDFYDVFRLTEDRVAFVLADASGHGVTAAMLSAMFKMTLRKYAFATDDPSRVLTQLNHDFCSVLQMGEFFTAFYAIFDLSTRELSYCNAAHPYPLLFDYSAKQVQELETDGFLLGIMEEGITFETKRVKIGDRARLIVFTDGLTEAANAAGTLYGSIRLKNDLKHLQELPADEFISAVCRDLSRFTEEESFEDDVTLLIVDFYED